MLFSLQAQFIFSKILITRTCLFKNRPLTVCVYIYIYIYIHTHTHTKTPKKHTHIGKSISLVLWFSELCNKLVNVV